VATFFGLVSILPFVFESLNLPGASNPWFILIKCGVLLFVIGFLLQQPRLLYGFLFVDAQWKTGDADNLKIGQIINNASPVPVSPKSNLLPAQATTYTEAMIKLMKDEKLFLTTDFQISHLAQKLDIPVHQCSYLINNVIGKNFRDWINAHRIDYFISNYPGAVDKMTIEAIASQSGFKSMATFYNAFKKETGLMPKTYFLEQEKLVGK
jgi:AraC-like DNA-binding protein